MATGAPKPAQPPPYQHEPPVQAQTTASPLQSQSQDSIVYVVRRNRRQGRSQARLRPVTSGEICCLFVLAFFLPPIAVSMATGQVCGLLIFNNTGKPRLSKYYTPSSPQKRAQILTRIFNLVSERDDTLCNFVELPQGFGFIDPNASQTDGYDEDVKDENLKVIYRHYATLYFVFIVDQSESELGILDLIQVFVESLDRCFENVCELDLIFHFDEVHTLLGCLITGGLVLDTSIDSIQANFSAQIKARKASSSSGISTPTSLLGSASEQWDALGLSRFTSRAR
ncbi:Sigma-adaptin 3A [Microbotryomycetes sp. JL221]|nr:Sigma-adaptin 3A [Microbotryomycetes sp. JL221]